MTAHAPAYPVATLREQRRDAVGVHRSLGPTSPDPFTAVPPQISALPSGSGAWRWLAGVGDDRARSYPVPAEAVGLGEWCLVGSGAATRRHHALAGIGESVRALHAVVPEGHLGIPPALSRVLGFLTTVHEFAQGRTAVGPGGAAGRRQRLLAQAVAPGVAAELLEDARQAASVRAGVLSHGWLGLNSWFVGPGVALGLVGEDLGIASRAHDLGSVLAQLVEYQHFAGGLLSAADVQQARAALLEGYAVAVDPAMLDLEIRLAVARHLGDYILHTDGPDEDIVSYAALLSALPGAKARR